jgi:hypothetical protein
VDGRRVFRKGVERVIVVIPPSSFVTKHTAKNKELINMKKLIYKNENPFDAMAPKQIENMKTHKYKYKNGAIQFYVYDHFTHLHVNDVSVILASGKTMPAKSIMAAKRIISKASNS